MVSPTLVFYIRMRKRVHLPAGCKFCAVGGTLRSLKSLEASESFRIDTKQGSPCPFARPMCTNMYRVTGSSLICDLVPSQRDAPEGLPSSSTYPKAETAMKLLREQRHNRVERSIRIGRLCEGLVLELKLYPHLDIPQTCAVSIRVGH